LVSRTKEANETTNQPDEGQGQCQVADDEPGDDGRRTRLGAAEVAPAAASVAARGSVSPEEEEEMGGGGERAVRRHR
jgi:hypothetical protein